MSPVKNIFIIDDDTTFVFLTKKIIKSTGIDINLSEFNDGQEAFEFLRENADNDEILPDIIFLDLSMPIMDGWEFLEVYAFIAPKIKKDIRLYIFSSSISPHDIERAKEFNMVTNFIIKPLVKEKFIELIENRSVKSLTPQLMNHYYS